MNIKDTIFCLFLTLFLSPLMFPSMAVAMEHVHLYSKDPFNWEKLPGAAKGKLSYQQSAPTFNFSFMGKHLVPGFQYTLIYYPDPWPGQDLICLGAGMADEKGKLALTDMREINTNLPTLTDDNYPDGAKVWLVLSSDVDCDNRNMLAWSPDYYLFEQHLITYEDTNIVVDHSGTYCFILEEPSSIFSSEIVFQQSGNSVTANVDGVTASGTVDDHTMNLTVDLPEDGTATMELVFADDLETFTGVFTSDSGIGSITGTEGDCTDYVFPERDPACILPVADTALVTRGQQYNAVNDGVRHTGIDFQIETNLASIIAPCDGVITGISRHVISLGNIIVDVNIKFNDNWSMFIAFEPYSPDPGIADLQEAEIAVSINQVVHQGDLLGRLIVPEVIEFPHIHWQINRTYPPEDVCPRDYLTSEAQAELDVLFDSFGLFPPCLP